MNSSQVNVCGLFIFLLSMIILIFSFHSIYINGIKIYNAFLLVFNFFLILNTMNLSDIQVEKNWIDIYYFFVGQLLYSLFLYLGEKKLLIRKIKISSPKFLSINTMFYSCLVIYIISIFTVYSKSGVRLFAGLDSDFYFHTDYYKDANGFYGLSFLSAWLLIAFSFYYKKVIRYFITTLFCILSGVFLFKREFVLYFI